MIATYLSTVVMIQLGLQKNYDTKTKNQSKLFDEFLILVIIYHLLCFSDIVELVSQSDHVLSLDDVAELLTALSSATEGVPVVDLGDIVGNSVVNLANAWSIAS